MSRTPSGGYPPLLFVVLAAGAFSASCRQGIVPANAIMHPTEENLPAPGGPLIGADTVLSSASDPGRAANWAAARRAILDAEIVTRIGAATGDGPDVLGIVGDAAIDEDGNVYIQENTTDELLVFSPSGDLLHRTGGTGDGPEEFRGIRRFVRLPDGRLVVAHDGGAAKVLELRDQGYRYAGLLLEDQTSEIPAIIDMCVVGKRIFLHATNLGSADPDPHRIIREVSTDEARVTASLADGYLSEFEEDRQRRSYGTIACGDGPPALVWSLYYFPVVKAYRPDNTLLWTALIEDFEQGLIYQNNARSSSVHPIGSSQEYLIGTHALRPGFVVVQAVQLGRPVPNEGLGSMPVLRMRTYLLDQETGNGGVVSDDLPWIAWIGESSFITVPSDPYPKVEVRGLSPELRRVAEERWPVQNFSRRQCVGQRMTRDLTRTTGERDTR